MSTAFLTHPPIRQISESEATEAAPRSLGGVGPTLTIPTWSTDDLVRQLNALGTPQNRDLNDPEEALRLYAADVKRAIAHYHELGCRIASFHMARAGDLTRVRGELAPKNIVIIGATGGMGTAVAEHAAHHGTTINLLDVPDAHGQPTPALLALAEQCRAIVGADKVQILAVRATDDAAMHAAMQQAANFGGGAIDLVSHSAGIFGDKRAFELTTGHLSLLMNVNARSTLVAVNAALPHLMKSQNPAFIFVSSMAATEFVGNQAEYCFTKHHQSEGMNLLGHLLSHHLRVKVTELRFGHVLTPMCEGRGLDGEKMIKVNNVADLVWNIAKAPAEMRFKAVEVTPSERLEGEVVWPDAELARLAK